MWIGNRLRMPFFKRSRGYKADARISLRFAVLRKNSVFVEKTEVEAGGVMVVDWVAVRLLI